MDATEKAIDQLMQQRAMLLAASEVCENKIRCLKVNKDFPEAVFVNAAGTCFGISSYCVKRVTKETIVICCRESMTEDRFSIRGISRMYHPVRIDIDATFPNGLPVRCKKAKGDGE